MTESSSRQLSHRVFFKREFGEVSKTAVIAIAATATVLVVAVISGCIICFVRRRGKKARNRGRGKHSSADVDTDSNSLHKAPLMQQYTSSQISDYQGVPAPRYNEETDIAMSSPYAPERRTSTGTIRSLPPSYSAATGRFTENVVPGYPQTSHRPSSSLGGSDGLRPLMLVNSQQSPDEHDQIDHIGRSRSGSATTQDRASLMPILPPGRPRASSRFREENLDL